VKKESKSTADKIVDVAVDGTEAFLSGFVLLDTIKNSTLSAVGTGDIKKLKKISDSLKGSDIPKSIMANAVEGIDVVMDINPKFAAEYPDIAAAAGVAIDLLDPVGNVSRILKAPAPIFNLAKKMGRSLKVKGAEKIIKKNINKKDMKKVGSLLKTIDEKNLYGKLGKPSELLVDLEGSSALQGAKLQEFVEKISERAPEINRKKILDKMVEARSQKNISETKTGVREVGEYRKTMSPVLKAEKEVIEEIPAVAPKDLSEISPPLSTSTIDDTIKKLEKEKSQFISAETARKSTKPKIGILAGETPPPVPTEAVKRPLEEVMSDLARAKQVRDTIEKTNKQIAKQVEDATPKIKKTIEPVTTGVDELWELKKDIRKDIPESKRGVPLDDVQARKAEDLRESIYAIDEAIANSLGKVMLPDGQNAADVYKALNKDISQQKELMDFLKSPTLKEWKKTSPVLPALAGGAAAVAATALGLPAGAAMATGLVTGAAARQARQGIDVPLMNLGRAIESDVGASIVKEIPSEIGTSVFGGENARGGYREPEIMKEKLSPEEMQQYDFKSLEKVNRSPKSTEVAPEMDMMPPEAMAMPEEMPMQSEAMPMPEEAMPMPMQPEQNYVSYADEVLNAQPLQLNPYISDQVLNTPLPRDSKRILANPEVLRAKMGQAAPDKLPMVEDMLRNDPELLADGLAKIAGLVPSLFEKDKYGSFDGMIKNPEMQQKFLNDLRSDEGLSSIEKANMSMKLFRGQRIM
jgi:hypothetical protein